MSDIFVYHVLRLCYCVTIKFQLINEEIIACLHSFILDSFREHYAHIPES